MRLQILMVAAALGCECGPGLVESRDENGHRICAPAEGLDAGPPALPGDAGDGVIQACWSYAEQAPDPITVTQVVRPRAPELVQCSQALVHQHNRRCVVDACAQNNSCPEDGIDNNCNGCIDERGLDCCVTCGGRPVPPADIVPKPSAFTLRPDDAWIVGAYGIGCGEAHGRCHEEVFRLRYVCGPGAIGRLETHVVVLARDRDTCLYDSPRRPYRDPQQGEICGNAETVEWLLRRLNQCGDGRESVALRALVHNDRIELELALLDSPDPSVPPVTTMERHARSLVGLFGCVADAVALANQFGDRADADPADGTPDQCQRPDEDGDGIWDEDDNCPTVSNADQADGDADEIGDACCGLDDPDGDGIDNCDFLPDGNQRGAPVVSDDWAAVGPTPGRAWCDRTGKRVCAPAGTWTSTTAPAIEQWAEQAIVEQAVDPSTVHRVRAADRAVVLCNMRLGDAHWTLDAWRACMDEVLPLVEDPPVGGAIARQIPMPGGGQIAAQFGLMGQRVVWYLGGFAGRRSCEYDREYSVVLRGVQRHGLTDIECRSTVSLQNPLRPRGQPGVIMEVKWYRTDANVWPTDRLRAFIDQTERHWLHWQEEASRDPSTRLVYMFGFEPPEIAKNALAKRMDYGRLGWPGPAVHPPILPVSPMTGIVDRALPGPWLAGRVYWTRFIPTDFRLVRGILDEAPCADCGLHPEMCDLRRVFLPTVELVAPECEQRGDLIGCDFYEVEIPLTRQAELYISRESLRRWTGMYQRWCVEGRARGCTPALSTMYDKLKCTEW